MHDTTHVADIMTRNVIVLSEEDNLCRIAEGLDRFRFHHIPVVDGTKLVGMLSQRDMFSNSAGGLRCGPFSREKDALLLERTFVRDVMSSTVPTALPDELVSTAAERMLEGRVGALPVVNEHGEVVGIVTEHDIMRLVARSGTLAPAV